MKVQVLGSGCAKCKSLAANVRQAISELGIQAEVEKVEDIKQIMSFGVMSTPALVVDGRVEVCGRVPSAAELKQLLSK